MDGSARRQAPRDGDLELSEKCGVQESFGSLWRQLNSEDESAFGIRAFVERFYTEVLGRQPDKGGFTIGCQH